MLEIPSNDFTKLTEIVTRWESNSDSSSATEKSIRDRLLPLVASIRGFCVTPDIADATSPATVPEDWYNAEIISGPLPDNVTLETQIDDTDLGTSENSDAP